MIQRWLKFLGFYISKCQYSDVRRRCGSHKSEFLGVFVYRHDSTLRRKSPHRVLGSLNHLNNMKFYPPLAATSLFRNMRNGKNIEKYQHLHFLMWASLLKILANSEISRSTWCVCLAQQQAGLGWDCQNHAGSVQRFMGGSGHYLSEYRGHRIAGRLLDWSSYPSLSGALKITLFAIGDAGMIFILYFHFETPLSHS